VAVIETADAVAIGATDISSLKEISSLGTNSVVALTTDQVKQLGTDQIIALKTVQFDALTAAQFSSLGANQVAAITTANAVAIGSADITSLPTIDKLGTASVAALTTDQAKAMTTAQVALMTTAQFVALTSDQFAAFSSAQVAVVSPANAIAIGTGAGQGTTSGQGANSIAIGNLAGQGSQVAGSICINASGTALNPGFAGCFINPVRSLSVSGASVAYWNPSTKELSYLVSSATTKNTIEALTVDTSVVYGLAPKTYLYNADPEAGLQVGYIAEEVAALNKNFATYHGATGEPLAIDYNTIIVFLAEELKKLRERVRLLEGR
jgi:hypothetical protein